MRNPMNVTLRSLRRLQATLRRRQKEARPCPDICIVLPAGFGFRPGDEFEASFLNGKLIVTNRSKVTAKQRQKLAWGGGTYHAQVENADWSVRLLPCPFCGSRGRLWPDNVVDEELGLGSFEVRCCGCGAQTRSSAFRTPEEAVAGWNWRVQVRARSAKRVQNPPPAVRR